MTFIDAFWGLGLAGLGVATFVQADGSPARMQLLTGLAVLWGVRLGVHILARWRREGPDRRYVKILDRAQAQGLSYARAAWIRVFQLQAVILWVVAMPVQLGQMSSTPPAIGLLGGLGAALAVFGLAFETLADHQLTRFKANPENRRKVLDTGLWRYTRHPNYFGDLCVWFGLWLIAAETTLGLFAVVGPLLLLVLFVRFSGGRTYETRLTHHRPGYADYIARTSPLIPWPPRAAPPSEAG